MRTTPSSVIFAVMGVPFLLSMQMYCQNSLSCHSYSERLR